MSAEGNTSILTFTYEVTGVGWSRGTITDGASTLTMRVSYLSDALRDLTDAVIALMRGAAQAACTWHDEPGRYAWTFAREDDEVTITITAGHDVVKSLDRRASVQRTPDRPAVLFIARCPLRRFAGQVLTQLWRILCDIGLEDYKKAWRGHDFPLTEYRTLEQLMKQQGGSPAGKHDHTTLGQSDDEAKSGNVK